MDTTATKIQGIVFSVKSHTKFGFSAQMNTDLISEEELAAVFALCKSIAEYDDIETLFDIMLAFVIPCEKTVSRLATREDL